MASTMRETIENLKKVNPNKITAKKYKQLKRKIIKQCKPITTVEGYYISKDGRVFNLKSKARKMELKQQIDKDGYRRITLIDADNKHYVTRVHRLVATAFVPGKREGLVVNHKNGIKDDNHYSNLEWMTPADNERHARRVLGKWLLGEKASRSKLTEKQVLKIRNMLKSTNASQQTIGILFGVTQSQIGRIRHRIHWNHI